MSGEPRNDEADELSAVTAAQRVALRLLERRPRTVAELSDLLADRHHAPHAVEQVLERLVATGVLDDGELALHYILTRAPRLGHGPERLQRELVQRGVDASVAAAAWTRAVGEGGLEERTLVRTAVSRRVGPAETVDRRVYRRVYDALRRAGFAAHATRAELDPRARFDASDEEDVHDDLA